MRFTNLSDWLSWQETLHPSEIELGLERVREVFLKLHPDTPPFKVISVAGTNGKGSSVAMLQAIYLAAGYRVGTYTSPHLLRYNERVRLNGNEVNDERLVQAFARIDAARAETSLTYFEFGTLAALDIFYHYPDLNKQGDDLDIVLLEVGLGGRLDAVNIIDADVALITSISLDHTGWLGDNREAIAGEKAGIMRENKAVVFSGQDMPAAIETSASTMKAKLYALNRDYHYRHGELDWQWQSSTMPPLTVPYPALKGGHQVQNAAGALMAVQLMNEHLPVNHQSMRQGLLAVRLEGRFQLRPGEINWVFDVAHNPESMAQLAKLLREQNVGGQTRMVIGMLRDKDAGNALRDLAAEVVAWFVAPLQTERSFLSDELASIVQQFDESTPVNTYGSVKQACRAAKQQSQPGDRIVVCGSFYTVAEAVQADIY